MDGKGFTKKVSDGDKVHAGDILVEANLEEIKECRISDDNHDDSDKYR